MIQPSVPKLAYLDALSFSVSKYICFYMIMTIITQVELPNVDDLVSDLKVPEVISLEPLVGLTL